jgi:hypothetical protein
MLVELPPLYTPFSTAINPAVNEVTEQGLSWMKRMGLCPTQRLERQVRHTRSGEFCARISPHAPLTPLQLAVDITYLGFLLDDLHNDGDADQTGVLEIDHVVAFTGAFLHAFTTGDDSVPHAQSFGAAAADIGRRARAYGTPAEARRLTEALHYWGMGVCWQVASACRRQIPDLNTCLAYRGLSSGGAFVSPWFEMFLHAEHAGHTMREDILNSPPMQTLVRVGWMVATLDNDLVSYAKEVRGSQQDLLGAAALNCVAAAAVRESRHPADAMHHVAALRNALVLLFGRLCDRILATSGGEDDEIGRYLDNYGTMIRGNLDWSLRCERYADSDHPDGPISFSIESLADPPPDIGPPPYPALRWMWQV